MEAGDALLPLDEPRVIAVHDARRVYRFTFGRITQADWERYFAGIPVTSKNEGRAQLNVTAVDRAFVFCHSARLRPSPGSTALQDG